MLKNDIGFKNITDKLEDISKKTNDFKTRHDISKAKKKIQDIKNKLDLQKTVDTVNNYLKKTGTGFSEDEKPIIKKLVQHVIKEQLKKKKEAKEVKEYFSYDQDLINKQYHRGEPSFQPKDDPNNTFFNQVRKVWQEKHKEAATMDMTKVMDNLQSAYKTYFSTIKNKMLATNPNASKKEVEDYLEKLAYEAISKALKQVK